MKLYVFENEKNLFSVQRMELLLMVVMERNKPWIMMDAQYYAICATGFHVIQLEAY